MKTFLEYVAEDIIRKCGTDLSRTVVVFPNKRASLFLNEHLARMAGKPIWSPVYITISELFRRHSDLQVADPIKLICDLHKCFLKVTGTQETLDHFYGWGQLLLSDFDDIDKNMADAHKVFANVRDLHELDDVSYLTPEQEEALRQFFSNFKIESASELKRRFLDLWTHLYEVYTTFNQCVREQGLAYEGALYREVVSNPELNFPYERYIFIGFNVLHEVEQRLFSRLKEEGKAMFYWDFDSYYMPRNQHILHEAGHYVSLYKSRFPNELDDADERIYDNFKRKKQIRFISATTEDIQARYVAQWLAEQDKTQLHGEEPDTAVVMCNENLLPSVVHSIPDDISRVNITTGYPLHNSPYAIGLLAGLRKKSSPIEFIEWGKTHLTDEASTLKAPSEKLDDTDRQLRAESLYRLFTLLQRLEGLIKSGDLIVSQETLGRLFRQLLRSTSVPFHGEPAVGLQIMGVLETRNIDFKNVLILSCNEGNMPKGVSDTSFIPYNVRKAYGLTTIDHKVSVYAYYFHRMIQRAENITIVYNSSTEDGNKGEMSRFMLQMMVESNHKIDYRFLKDGPTVSPLQEENCAAGQQPSSSCETMANEPLVVEKSPKIIEAMLSRFGVGDTPSDNPRLLTPTPINSYMKCPMRFYYHYILNIKESDELEEGQVDGRLFGNLFHESAQRLYERHIIKRGMVSKADIEQVLKTGVDIERVVDEEFHKQLNATPPYTGLYLITRSVIITYLKRLLKKDLLLAPFRVLGLEVDVKKEITLNVDYPTMADGAKHAAPLRLWLGGRVDRLDCIDVNGSPRLRVVDYKTGSRPMKAMPDVESIFDAKRIKEHSDYYLQTFIYSLIVRHDSQTNPNNHPVAPALFFIQHAEADDYDPTLMLGKEIIADVDLYRDAFEAMCSDVINEMFSIDKPFVATDDKTHCKTCPYASLCRR